MMFERLFHWIRGYVVVLVEGYFLERFINICTKRNLYLWDFRKLSNTSMQVKISIRGFKQLRPVAKKSRCRIRIRSKKGLPFFAARYKKRYAILVGIAVFLILFYIMTSFIWVIEFTGQETLTQQELLDSLTSCGIHSGTFSSSIDTIELQNKLRTVNSKLAWVGVEVSGSKLKISVQERVIPPAIYDKNTPYNIVARQDGVIDKMIVRYGKAEIEVGDTVKQGQVLVSGNLTKEPEEPAPGETEPEQPQPRYVNSDASIYAKTWYERRTEVSLIKEVKNYTGETTKHNSLKIFGFSINFFRNGSIPYEKYDTIEHEKELVLFGKTLPISLISREYSAYETNGEPISQDAAAQAYAESFEEEIRSGDHQDFTVLSRNVQTESLDETKIMVRVVLECSEDIAQKEAAPVQ